MCVCGCVCSNALGKGIRVLSWRRSRGSLPREKAGEEKLLNVSDKYLPKRLWALTRITRYKGVPRA